MNTDGFWLIDKQPDWTSFDVCAKLRKMLKIKKVGHTGTLDPFATGLLLVATGKATKLIPYLEKESKTYIATIVLGKTSETLDSESKIQDCGFDGNEPTQADIQKVIDAQFTGKIQQIPPKFSALKINGKPAYKLAREGKKVEIKARDAETFEIEILQYDFPEVEVKLTVAAGFYVRSFARDLGMELSNGGYCSQLRRTAIGELSVDDAELLEMVSQPIDPMYILKNMDHREISTERIQDFIAGRSFPMPGIEKQKVLVTVGNKSIGIGEFLHGHLQPRVVL